MPREDTAAEIQNFGGLPGNGAWTILLCWGGGDSKVSTVVQKSQKWMYVLCRCYKGWVSKTLDFWGNV